MYRNRKFQLSLILSVLIVFLLPSLIFAEDDAKEDWEQRNNTSIEGSKDLYVDANGNVYYNTSDKEATTDITYKTEGIVISDPNNPSNGVVLPITDMPPFVVPVPSPSGTIILQEMRRIGNINELTALLGVSNLRMDCIMQTYQKGVPDGIYYSDASLLNLLAAFYQCPLSELGTVDQLLKVYGWIDKSGILSHFDWRLKLLALGFTEEQLEELEELAELDPEDPDKIIGSKDRENVIKMCSGPEHDETPEAEYKTGTESVGNKYCIFEGIPSGKNLNNYFEADKWRAGTEAWAVNQARPFSWTVTYVYENWVTVGYEENADGSQGDPIQELRRGSYSQNFSGLVASSYTYLEKPSVYASFTGTVTNKAFDSDKSYSGPSGSGSYTGSGHLTFKKPAGLPYASTDGVAYLGLGGDARIPGLIVEDGKQVYAAYKRDGVESQNDDWTFTVDGKSFHMIDGGGISTKGYVIGNEMWEPNATELPNKLTHHMFPDSASVMYHYAKSNGGQYLHTINPENKEDSKKDFPIPKNTDNGRYNTKVSLDFSLVESASKGDNWNHSFSTSTPYSEHTIASYNPGKQCKTPGGCKRETKFDVNYPVEVHTPIHSPVQILDGDGSMLEGTPKTNYEGATENTKMKDGVTGNKGNNQLVQEAEEVDYALSLDHWYAIRWDWFNHRKIQGYGESENGWDGTNDDDRDKPSKYDEFVTLKTMKFPFEVMYDGKYYAAGEEITVNKPSDIEKKANYKLNSESREYESENHWVIAPIYIPSYAREIKGDITYRVIAYNVDARYTGNHFLDEEVEGNITYDYEEIGDKTGKGAKYVATYKIPVETYGIIYDFSIVGTSDTDVHKYNGGRKSNISTDFCVPFAKYKEEKKVGTKNRLGNPTLRYLLDGAVTNSWNPKNTLVLENGKSTLWENMGSVVKGTKFSFTVKTIANLWGKNDHVIIKPTFRYISDSGKELSDDKLLIYYDSPTTDDIFILRGGNRDKNNENVQYVKIGDSQFEGSYYSENMAEKTSNPYHFGNWPKFTAEKENEWTGSNIDAEDVLGRKTPSYCMSSIDLKSSQRLLSGEYEQLEWNLDYDAYNTKDSFGKTLKRYNDLGMSGAANFNTSDKETRDLEDLFKYSMQTWYGQFYVPSNLYIVDLTKHPGFDLAEYIKDKGGEIEYTDPVFEKNGALIVNFNIMTYKTPKDFETGKETSSTAVKHLKYYGGSGGLNMWRQEGFNEDPYIPKPTPDPGDPDSPAGPEDPKDPTVPTPPKYKDGDVIIVDLSQSIEDRYEAGLFNIN